MDGLMDLEMTHNGCGRPLLQEFFPGRLRKEEEEWWDSPEGKRADTEYDKMRLKEYVRRARPRSMLPRYNLHATPSTNNAHSLQNTHPMASTTSVATAAVTSIESSTVVPEPNRTEPGFDGVMRITSPARQQRPPSSLQYQRRRMSSPPIHQRGIGASNTSPRSIRNRPTSSSTYDNLRGQANWPQRPAGTRNDIGTDNSQRPAWGRNSPIGRVSTPTSPIRHENRVVTPPSRKSTLSPPGTDLAAARGGINKGQRAALWDDSDEGEDDYAANQEDVATLRHGGEQSEGTARRVQFSRSSAAYPLDSGNGGDSEDNNIEPPSLVDIAEEMPKRPFWD